MTDRITTFAELEREFSRIEFSMPGWRVSLVRPAIDLTYEAGSIVLEMFVSDSRTPGRTIPVTSMRSVPSGFPAERLPRFVFSAIRELAEHELREWFRVDGELVYDPHKEGTKL